MEEYVFLFVIGILWLIVASWRDIKTTIVPNWISYSFILFALVYRVFYSLGTGNWDFLYYGALGFVVFYIVGVGLYYARVFAGGDAKLIWGAQISPDMDKSLRVLLIVTGVKSTQILGHGDSMDRIKHREIEEELGIEFFE